MRKTDLSGECKELKLIIDDLITGKEKYEIYVDHYSLEDVLGYLRDFLQELEDINDEILLKGKTPEILKKVYEKYTQLWISRSFFGIDRLSHVIGGLWHFSGDRE